MTREAEKDFLRFGCLRTFDCGSSSVNCLRFFGDADHLLAGASNKRIYLLGAQLGVLCEFAGEHTDAVACIGADDSYTHTFLSGGLDRRAAVSACLFSRSASPSSHLAFVGDVDGRIRIFDFRCTTKKFGYVQVLTDAKDAISSIAAVDDRLLSASLDGCVYTYDLRRGQLHADCYGSPITWLTPSSDGTALLLSCGDASIRLVEAETGECMHAFWGHRQTSSSSFRMQSDFIASPKQLPRPPSPAAAAAAAAAGAAGAGGADIFVAGEDGVAARAFDELLEAAKGERLSAIDKEKPFIVSGSEDGCIYFWDVLAAARAVHTPQQGVWGRAHEAPALIVKTDTLSQRLCTAATDGIVKLWRQL